MRKLFDSSGFSLISALVAMGIMSIVGITMVTLFHNMNSANSGVKFRLEADTVQEEMRALLSDRAACLNTFGGRTADASTDIPNLPIRDGSAAPGVARYSIGQTYGDNRSFLLRATRFSRFMPNGGKPFLTYSAIFDSRGQVIGPAQVTREINISVELDAANRIVGCIALAKMSDGIWQRSRVNPNNAFFMPNNIGIGTNDPKVTLDVMGSRAAAFKGTANQLYIMDTNAAGPVHSVKWNLDANRLLLQMLNVAPEHETTAANTIAIPMVMSADGATLGFVGINNASPQARLDVGGDIRIGFAQNCNQNTAGALRYVAGTKSVEYCDGTNYKGAFSLKQDNCIVVNTNHCEYQMCTCPVGYYAVGIQVGIRQISQWSGANTTSSLRCCLP